MLDDWLARTKFKLKYEKLVINILANRISANQLTIIGLILGLISAFFVYLSGILQYSFELTIAAVIIMSISFVFDTFDGIIARTQEPTIFGGILDMICDRTVEVFIIISLVSTDPTSLIWPGLFSLGAIVLCITMFLIVGGAIKADELKESQKVIYFRKGLMERSETFIFLMMLTLFFPWRFIFLWIFAILIYITALLRLRDAYLLFKPKKKMTNEVIVA